MIKTSPMIYRFNDCVFDVDGHDFSRGGKSIDTEPKVLQVLAYLIEQRDRVVTRDELLDHCWVGMVVSDGTLSRCLSRVRQTVGQQRGELEPIQTVHGKGYRFIGQLINEPVASSPARAVTYNSMNSATNTSATLLAPDLLPVLDNLCQQPEPAPIEIPALSAERRHITALSCTLKIAPTILDQLDPEEMHQLMQTFRTLSYELIGQFEGTVVHYLNDRIVAYFGYPIAHEDDALRAVRAGLQLVEKLLQRGLIARVGIHSGWVIVEPLQEPGQGQSWQPPITVGLTPAVAAELCQAASDKKPDKGQGIVISAATAELVQGFVEQQSLGEYALSSTGQSVMLSWVSNMKPDQDRLAAMALRGLTPFIGRTAERMLLSESWNQACDGMGQAILISGEAGIGKSRLLRVFKEELSAANANTGWVLMETHSSPYHQNTAFHTISELWRRWFGLQHEQSNASKLTTLESGLQRYDRPLRETLPALTDLLDINLPADRHPQRALTAQRRPEMSAALQFLLNQDTPQRKRQRILEVLLLLVLEQAAKQPVLLLVEDVHWADPSSLEFLRLLMSQVTTVPIMVVLTCRADDPPPWALQAPVKSITLNRLSATQTPHLVTEAAAGKTLPPPLLQWLVDKTDGVPLFIEELTRLALESEHVLDCGTHYELNGPLDQLGIPATLHDLLIARLDRLPEGKEVAQSGAVLGRAFSYDLLAAVGPFDDATLQKGLQQLLAAQLIYQSGLASRAQYVFKHALIHNAAYLTLLKSRRRQLHLRVAQILERQFPDLVAIQPEQLAQHYLAAALPEKALIYLQRAGELALARYAMQEALRHFEQGLELVRQQPASEKRDRQELALLAALGPIYMALHGPIAPTVESTYSRAYELSQQLDQAVWQQPVLWGLWRFHLNHPRLSKTHELSVQMLRLASQSQNSDQLLVAHVASATTAWFSGKFKTADKHYKKARQYGSRKNINSSLAASYGGLDPLVFAQADHALVLWGLGFADQSLQCSREALALAQQGEQPNTLAFLLNFTNMLFLRRREPALVQQGAQQQIELAAEQGFDTWLINGRIFNWWAQLMQNSESNTNAAEQIKQSLEKRIVTGGEFTLPFWLSLLAEVYLAIGQLSDALQVLDRAINVMQRNKEHEWQAELYRMKAKVLLTKNPAHTTDAQAYYQQALTVARQQQARMLELRSSIDFARFLQAQDQTAEAYALLAPVYAWFQEGFDSVDLKDAKKLLMELS